MISSTDIVSSESPRLKPSTYLPVQSLISATPNTIRIPAHIFPSAEENEFDAFLHASLTDCDHMYAKEKPIKISKVNAKARTPTKEFSSDIAGNVQVLTSKAMHGNQSSNVIPCTFDSLQDSHKQELRTSCYQISEE
jgi:hypothetical protein